MKANLTRKMGSFLVLMVAAAGGTKLLVRALRSERTYVSEEVPAARSLFATKRVGFVPLLSGQLQTSNAANAADKAAPGVVTTAPPDAAGDFILHRRGNRGQISIRLDGARTSKVVLEDGHGVYRAAFPDVDVLAFSNDDSFELAYVVRSAHAADDLRFRVELATGDAVREEPSTHALLVEDQKHRARLRVTPPLAIDARGLHRAGRYNVDGNEVRLVLDSTGMVPPFVIDPTFSIPFWAILNDARVPASAVYDPVLQSREVHMVYDSVRGRTVLVRPVRSELDSDTSYITGNESATQSSTDTITDAVNAHDPGYLIPRARTTPPIPSAAVSADWQRGYDLESETWEFDGRAWSLVNSAFMPGRIDPALAFDAARARVVMYGGAVSSALGCSLQFGSPECLLEGGRGSQAPDDHFATYEYDGASWTEKLIPSSPQPRIRAAMTWSAALGKVVMFGGRALNSAHGSSDGFFLGNSLAFSNNYFEGAPASPAYPENATGDLLNETWTYDGESWKPVLTGTPPPASEGAQLVYDAGRGVVVLVGGHTNDDIAPNVDRLAIWEFDGTDWSQKLAPGSSALPPSIATRRGAAAFYNSIRQRVTILGGTVAKLDFCTLSDAEIAAQTAAAGSDPVAVAALQATGCLGGYVHDSWEWDGTSLTKVSDVVYGGASGQQAVFEQAAGASPWTTAAGSVDGGAPPANGPTALLPYRFDETSSHFQLRTELERAHLSDAGPPAAPAAANGAETQSAAGPISPLFTARVHPDVVFDTARGVANVFVPDSAAVYTTNGATWNVLTSQTPFSAGPNDFFASTWDSVNQRIILFDPRDASTWAYTDTSGWTLLPVVGAGPTRWSVDPSVHAKRDIVRTPTEKVGATEAPALLSALPQIPEMTFDRTRGRVVMLFGQATWEFDGTAWTSHPYPPTWSQCSAGRLIAFDGARGRSVAFGCNVPADTWQWDGNAWSGPGPSPYIGLVDRSLLGLAAPAPTLLGVQPDWFASLQLAWAHPNAAFESPTLGGVSIIDSDGAPRTWNGSTWTAGPGLSDKGFCRTSGGPFFDVTQLAAGLRPTGDDQAPFPYSPGYLLGRALLPMCFSPPTFEDAANGRIVAFRDGLRSMQELPLSGPTALSWAPVAIANAVVLNPEFPDQEGIYSNPYPFELMAPERIRLTSQSDPATRVGVTDYPYEEAVEELWWPYRILVDPISHRTRILTSRGAVWELTGEPLQGLGGACKSDLDCAVGGCDLTEGVCCDLGNACVGGSSGVALHSCWTCLGKIPGICSPVVPGQPDPSGACGAGQCAATCVAPSPANGVPASCAFNPAVPCGPSTSCSGGVVLPGGHCSAASQTCILPGASLPACPVVNGVATVTTDCVPPPEPCAGGLACADGVSCKTGACASRADCGRYNDCNATLGTCAPDLASQLATQQGITPAAIEPPPRWTNAEIAGAMADAGLQTDDAGRFIVFGPDDTNTMAAFGFDPKLSTPELSFRNCVEYIGTCMALNKDIDSCVALTPRCASATPWNGDPMGLDCCPQSCLVQYLTNRPAMSPAAALQTMVESQCYLPSPNGGADGGTE